MRPPVFLHVALLGEGLAAKVTSERLVAAVDTEMGVEVGALGEPGDDGRNIQG